MVLTLLIENYKYIASRDQTFNKPEREDKAIFINLVIKKVYYNNDLPSIQDKEVRNNSKDNKQPPSQGGQDRQPLRPLDKPTTAPKGALLERGPITPVDRAGDLTLLLNTYSYTLYPNILLDKGLKRFIERQKLALIVSNY